MPVIVVGGGQWGDEGKGRIVDLLAQKAHLVARYSAGANAGHTVVNEVGEFALHLVPAGIFYPDKLCVIGGAAGGRGGDGPIGPTGRGVGPAFVDKVGRAGVRVADLLDSESLLQLLSFLVPYKNAVLTKLYGAAPLSLESVHTEYTDYGERLAPSR